MFARVPNEKLAAVIGGGPPKAIAVEFFVWNPRDTHIHTISLAVNNRMPYLPNLPAPYGRRTQLPLRNILSRYRNGPFLACPPRGITAAYLWLSVLSDI